MKREKGESSPTQRVNVNVMVLYTDTNTKIIWYRCYENCIILICKDVVTSNLKIIIVTFNILSLSLYTKLIN